MFEVLVPGVYCMGWAHKRVYLAGYKGCGTLNDDVPGPGGGWAYMLGVSCADKILSTVKGGIPESIC